MDDKYQPNAEFKEVSGRLGDRAARAYGCDCGEPSITLGRSTSAPCHDYVPEERPTGTLRLCGNNYIGDSPLGGWWQRTAFESISLASRSSTTCRQRRPPSRCLGFRLSRHRHHAWRPSFYELPLLSTTEGHAPTGITF